MNRFFLLLFELIKKSLILSINLIFVVVVVYMHDKRIIEDFLCTRDSIYANIGKSSWCRWWSSLCRLFSSQCCFSVVVVVIIIRLLFSRLANYHNNSNDSLNDTRSFFFMYIFIDVYVIKFQKKPKAIIYNFDEKNG